MNDMIVEKPPASFYWISGLALLWNAFGIYNYLLDVTRSPEDLAAMPEALRTMYENVPAWATSAYAIAVNAGTLGCLLLLFRKALALPVLVLSLAGILVQMGHAFLISNAASVLGPTSMILPAIIIAVAVALIRFASGAKKRGWIR